jgi:hypothetical protein
MHGKINTAFALAFGVAIGIATHLLATQDAQAEGTRTATCTARLPLVDKRETGGAAAVAEWMNGQIAEGRSSFVEAENPDLSAENTVLCAW